MLKVCYFGAEICLFESSSLDFPCVKFAWEELLIPAILGAIDLTLNDEFTLAFPLLCMLI